MTHVPVTWRAFGLILAMGSLPGLTLSSCTASQAFVVTGKSADVLGQQFVTASNAMQAGLQQKLITKEQFLAWNEFSQRFDALYGKTVDLWKAAQLAKDDAVAGDLETAIGRLAVELMGFYRTLKELHLLPPDAP